MTNAHSPHTSRKFPNCSSSSVPVMEKTMILASFWVGLCCHLAPCSCQQQGNSFQGEGAQDAPHSTAKSPLRHLHISNNWLSTWNSSWNGQRSVWWYHCTALSFFHLLGHPLGKEKWGSRSQPNPRAPAKESQDVKAEVQGLGLGMSYSELANGCLTMDPW